jgi:hypothetical protein
MLYPFSYLGGPYLKTDGRFIVEKKYKGDEYIRASLYCSTQETTKLLRGD